MENLTLTEAAALLRRHQQWRRGEEIPMTDPRRLGVAIDIILEYLSMHQDETRPATGRE